jgi:hypothetical protein
MMAVLPRVTLAHPPSFIGPNPATHHTQVGATRPLGLTDYS